MASLLDRRATRRGRRGRASRDVVWTAIAFLFRHDYAVYCGVGFAIGDRRVALERLA